jgi:hypothetical protein
MNPESSHFDLAKEGISRRRMLKRIGAGAAIAWSAPVLTSIRTPAFAQGSPPGSACDEGQSCQPACDALRPCQQPSNCACFPTIDNSACHCGDIRDGSCSSFTPCSTQADCAGGEVCVGSCCPTGVCMPNCPGPGSQKRRQTKGGVRLAK